MQRQLVSFLLHSCLVNLLGVLLVTGLGLWNFAIWLIAPFFFYWAAMFLATVRLQSRSACATYSIIAALVLGHLLELALAFVFTKLLGRTLGHTFANGVELTELFFTNSFNSFVMGSMIAALGSLVLIRFHFAPTTATES